MQKDDFQFLTLLSTKLQNTLAPNSLDKLMQLISIEAHVYDLDRGKITDLGKFTLCSIRLMQFNYSQLFKDSEIKNSLSFWLCFHVTMLLDDKILLPQSFMFFSLPFFLNPKSPTFEVGCFEKPPELTKGPTWPPFTK